MFRFLTPISILAILFLYSCEEPFERPKDLQGGQVVIYGRVSNLLDDSYVEVGITRNKTSKPLEVEGANVHLIDSEGARVEFCEKELGIYVPQDAGFRGTIGVTYDLHIVLPDGREYAAFDQKIPEPTIIDSVYTDFVKKEVIRETLNSSLLNFLEIRVDADLLDDTQERFVRWDLEETFTILQTAQPGAFRYFICFVSQGMSLQQVNLISSKSFTTSKVNGVYLGDRLVDYAFGVKHATEIFQRTISEDTYKYWSEINKVATISGSIFDNPPAPVFGNVISVENNEEVVIGYFEATGTTMKRIFNYGSEMEEPQEDPCAWAWFKRSYAGYCLNCLSHPNSSYEFEQWYVLDELF